MTIGVVVIGRNEGPRLRRCLESALRTARPIVYVDSGSGDGSVALAAALGVETLELERSRPFSAARARNEGFERLLAKFPGIGCVQFLDADCTLFAGWLEAAAQALAADARRAAVIGELMEREPGAGVYSRLCALEWRSAPGDPCNPASLVGIAMMRADVFRALGGFRPQLIAGEDPELGIRMALAGYKVTRIACPMATHEAGITRFAQWWRRAVRAGHAIGQRCDLHGRSAVRDCVRERSSTVFWAMVLPLIVACSAPATRGASLLLLAAYAVLWFRVWRRRRGAGDSAADAVLYATFVLIAKFAHAVGLARFFFNKRAGRYEIIEYK